MKVRITHQGVAYEVDVEVLDEGAAPAAPVASPAPIAQKPIAQAPIAQSPTAPIAQNSNQNAVLSPISGIVVELSVALGAQVALNQKVAVIEAMKMRTPIMASKAGKVARLLVAAGEAVREGQALIELA